MGRTIGIDLGNTNLYMAALDDGDPVMLASAEGEFAIPAMVSVDLAGDLRVGRAAQRIQFTNSDSTIVNFLQFLGMDRALYERQQFSEHAPLLANLPYRVTFAPDGMLLLGEQQISPEQALAHLLAKLKQDAEAFLETAVSGAMIAVPDGMDIPARQVVLDAAAQAGFTSCRLIAQSHAALFSYGADMNSQKAIVVVHMGGFTARFTLMQTGGGTANVLTTLTHPALGGIDAIYEIVNRLADEFEQAYGVDLRQDPMALQRLFEGSQAALIALADTDESTVNLPYISANDNGPLHLSSTITRRKYGASLLPMVRDIGPLIDEGMERAQTDNDISFRDIERVLATGGMMFHLQVRGRVLEATGQRPLIEARPDMVVAAGAALAAKAGVEDVMPVMPVWGDQVARLNASLADLLTQPDPPAPKTGHIFISYSRANTAIMQEVADSLAEAQITPWTDSQLVPGTPVWEREIETAIENAAALVAILSPDAKQSDWVARELSYADELGVRIFPLLIEGDTRSAVPFRLSSTQRIDATGDFTAAMQQLIAVLRAHLG